MLRCCITEGGVFWTAQQGHCLGQGHSFAFYVFFKGKVASKLNFLVVRGYDQKSSLKFKYVIFQTNDADEFKWKSNRLKQPIFSPDEFSIHEVVPGWKVVPKIGVSKSALKGFYFLVSLEDDCRQRYKSVTKDEAHHNNL